MRRSGAQRKLVTFGVVDLFGLGNDDEPHLRQSTNVSKQGRDDIETAKAVESTDRDSGVATETREGRAYFGIDGGQILDHRVVAGRAEHTKQAVTVRFTRRA